MKYLGLLVQVSCVLALIFGFIQQKFGPFLYVSICVAAVLKLVYDCYVVMKKKK